MGQVDGASLTCYTRCMIDIKSMSEVERVELMTKVQAARELLAQYDPLGESMEVLAAAGCHSCHVKGITPTGMKFSMDGGAPKPARAKRTRSTPAPTTDTSVAFPVGDGSEIRLPVTRIAGGFARGPGGLCAFCAGDACGEDSAPDSPIARFFAANPIAPSCPVCDGRPS